MAGDEIRMSYLLVHQPERDATGYSVPEDGTLSRVPIDRVTFSISAPADGHEASLALSMSRAAWEAQGAPEEITIHMARKAVSDG